MFIIVKYALDHWPTGKAPIEASVYGSYSARELGIKSTSYPSKEAAEPDLEKLMEFNPTVHYGIVEVER